MNHIKVAIVGYGNIGKYAVEAVLSAKDMELVGVVRRSVSSIPPELKNIVVTDNIHNIKKPDVVLLCTPSRSVEETAKQYLSLGIHTVDSFDMHESILSLRNSLSQTAKQHNVVSILSAGWDPGSDSVVRALLQACAPKGITNTNFGPGMSMGHTVAAKSVAGVKNALSMTIPKGNGIHSRMVYVELQEGANFSEVAASIKADSYFVHDETYVKQVSDVDALMDKGHGVNLTRKGVSGETNNQIFSFQMSINNPALTSQLMVSCARATMRQSPGAYTMIEIPPVDLLPGERETWVSQLV